MDFLDNHDGVEDQIVALFGTTFSTSEGAEEGAIIGRLARALIETTPRADICVYSVWAKGELAGCIMCTRLDFPEDSRVVQLIAPVAIAPEFQNQGLGQALLTFGLDALRARGVDVAVTYGDPGFYAKVGFSPITQDQAAPPLPLQSPDGWLAQSLTGASFAPLVGPSKCVEAFNDPAYW